MRRILIFTLPLAFLFSCHSGSNQTNQEATTSSADQTTTAKPGTDKEEAWQSLFNGKDLSGWRGFQNKSTDAWDVVDGTLHCDGHKKDAAHTDLITEKSFKNFVLSLQWKISPESNSGIMFHVTEDQPRTSLSGPEYQIIDDEGWPGQLEPWQHTGANYAMQIPDPGTVSIHPVGSWNTTKIVVNDSLVEHWLNGKKLLQYELWSPAWEEQKAAGKWKDADAYGMAKKGHIALQYHGGDVWFKDLKIKEL